MHPIFLAKRRLFIYLLAWGVGSNFLGASLRLQGQITRAQSFELAIPLSFFYSLICLTPWYTCATLPLIPSQVPRAVWHHLGAAVLATAVWVGAGRLLAHALGIGGFMAPQMPLLVAMGLFLYGLSVAVHYTLLALQSSRDAALQAREAELRALKAQINPHFLFNSLNSIAALTKTDPAKAREMCIGLSGFLRRTLGLGERASITWEEEVQLARMYLDVEQIRFGKRLHVEMNLEEACAKCQVPPLVFQPLIENAIKHGIATLVDGGTIRVESRLEGDAMVAIVENDFDPDSPAPRPSGLGLRNIRSRLETRFGDAAWLAVDAERNSFRAVMSVPCRYTD